METKLDILVIPDYHADPEYDNLRMGAVANFLLNEQPKYIVQIGDWFNFSSISSWDKGKKSAENRRYQYDLEAGRDALEQLHNPINEYNRYRKQKYRPEFHITLGNHDIRMEKFVENNPEFEGFISKADLPLEEYGWKVTGFKEVLHLGGFLFSHYFSSGVMGRPIGGASIGNSAFTKLATAALSGHNHLLSLAVNTKGDGQKILSGSCGWFGHKDQKESYAKGSDYLWWNGIIMLRDCDGKGYADYEIISQERLLRKYL